MMCAAIVISHGSIHILPLNGASQRMFNQGTNPDPKKAFREDTKRTLSIFN
jgi:hypothetical protein